MVIGHPATASINRVVRTCENLSPPPRLFFTQWSSKSSGLHPGPKVSKNKMNMGRPRVPGPPFSMTRPEDSSDFRSDPRRSRGLGKGSTIRSKAVILSWTFQDTHMACSSKFICIYIYIHIGEFNHTILPDHILGGNRRQHQCIWMRTSITLPGGVAFRPCMLQGACLNRNFSGTCPQEHLPIIS